MAKPRSKDGDGVLTEEEIARRRDEGLRRLLKMPPKPHAQITGKGKPKKKPIRKRKAAKRSG